MQVTKKPIVVYPNSGEHYDPVIKQWVVSLPFIVHCLWSLNTCFSPTVLTGSLFPDIYDEMII